MSNEVATDERAAPHPDEVLRQRPDVAQVVIDDTTILYDSHAQRSHQLNSSASLVWALLEDGRALRELQADLLTRFPSATDEIRRDTETVVGELLAAELLVVDTDEPGADETDVDTAEATAGDATAGDTTDGDRAADLDGGETTAGDATAGETTDGAPRAPSTDDVTSPGFDALGFSFDITGPRHIVEPIIASLRCLETSGAAEHHYRITGDPTPAEANETTETSEASGEVDADGPAAEPLATDRFQVQLDDESPAVTTRADVAGHVLWHVNTQACSTDAAALLMHASAVVTPTGVVAFSGTMNAGKSTLVAGLVRRGYRYLTDEAVRIQLDDLSITAYPKPIGIDAGAYDLFPELEAVANPLAGFRWWVNALDIGDGETAANASRHPLRAIVFIQYAESGPDEVESLEPAAAVLEMTSNLFNLAEHNQAGLDAVARVATTLPIYRLQHTGLDSAIDWIESTFPDT